jgi:hypothetical protein
MPRGVYARKQSITGYRSTGYLSSQIKRASDNRCAGCGERFPSASLRVWLNDSPPTSGIVYCTKCAAAKYFDKAVSTIPELIVKATDLGAPITPQLLSRWAKLGYIGSPCYGYLPTDSLEFLVILYTMRDRSATSILHALANAHPLLVRNLATGFSEVLLIEKDLGTVRLDGHIYHCSQLTNGSMFLQVTKSPTHAPIPEVEHA